MDKWTGIFGIVLVIANALRLRVATQDYVLIRSFKIASCADPVKRDHRILAELLAVDPKPGLMIDATQVWAYWTAASLFVHQHIPRAKRGLNSKCYTVCDEKGCDWS